ncbi:hypothetical protein K438DRAFT_1876030, partial [Mycena galopus ATCC 62051]
RKAGTKAGRRRAAPTPSRKSHTMVPLPDVSLSCGPMLTGVFINLILYGVFLGQVRASLWGRKEF